eukprot:g2949.t1
MDIVLRAVDDNFVTPAGIYPADWPDDYLPRQALTLFVVTLLGGYALYLSFACFSYRFLFDHDLRQHPKFLQNQERKELWCSCTSLPFMALLTVPLFVAEVRGHSQLYGSLDAERGFGVDEVTHVFGRDVGGWGYLVFSVLSFLFFNDFLIYWIHRALHSKLLYAPLHKEHHRWLVPTPFASHAFHPVDGFLQSTPYHIFVFLFPLHKMLYLTLFVLVNVWTISIHDGHYKVPDCLRHIVNGAAHHTDHHLFYSYNYGQYFTLWDYIGGSYRNPSPFEGKGPYDSPVIRKIKQAKGKDERAKAA